jgi:DNA-binding transcriptional ArsR family regulator
MSVSTDPIFSAALRSGLIAFPDPAPEVKVQRKAPHRPPAKRRALSPLARTLLSMESWVSTAELAYQLGVGIANLSTTSGRLVDYGLATRTGKNFGRGCPGYTYRPCHSETAPAQS